MGTRRLLSRVADSLYWMARYVERAENGARSIEVNLNLMLDQATGSREQWEPLILVTGEQERFKELYGEARPRNVLRFLTFEAENPNSILSCFRKARESARSVRDTISTELWEQINKAYLMVQSEAATGRAINSPSGFFEEVRLASQLIEGIASSTLSHGETYHFYLLGRMLERADATTRLADVKYFILLPSLQHVGTPLDDIQWAAVLRSASGFQMYRQKHGQLEPKRIAEFLLLDREFPRSVRFCTLRADEAVHGITGTGPGTYSCPAEQRLGQLNAELNYTSIDELMNAGMHEQLDELQRKLNAIDTAINDAFFTLGPVDSTLAVSQ
jgi:uncharacterized alpha-E superfamily protein